MTPQEEIQIRQMLASQRAAGQPMLRDQLPGMSPAPRITISTPEAEQAEARRQMMALQDAARLRGLLGSNFDQFNPQTLSEGMERARLARQPLESERAAYMRRAQLEQDRLASQTNGVAADPEPAEYDGFVDSGTGERGYMGFKYMPTPMDTSVTMAADPAPEEYDGFVDSGTGERGYMGGKYMPAPMDASVATAQANTAYMPPPQTLALSDPAEYDRRVAAYYRRPVPEGQQRTQEAYASAADIIARNAPANTAYMPPPTAAPVNTAYMPPPQAAPVNTAYMPPAQANTTYNAPLRRSPSSASTGFNPQPLPVATTTPSYGMSTPTYGMSNATTTPTYRGQATEQPSYSPKQAGKYNVDGTRLRNTGGLFNDLNAFFGRPQT